MQTELNETQLAFVAWRADPKREGTKVEWAKDHDISLNTLKGWEKTAWYDDAMQGALSDLALGTESVIEVITSLQRDAASGSSSASRSADLYLKFLDRVRPTREAPREDRLVEQLTDAELDLAWAEARAL